MPSFKREMSALKDFIREFAHGHRLTTTDTRNGFHLKVNDFYTISVVMPFDCDCIETLIIKNGELDHDSVNRWDAQYSKTFPLTKMYLEEIIRQIRETGKCLTGDDFTQSDAYGKIIDEMIRLRDISK